MIACSCPKCSTYGNASYCINDIIDVGRAEYAATHANKPVWISISLWFAGAVCLVPIVIRIADAISK